MRDLAIQLTKIVCKFCLIILRSRVRKTATIIPNRGTYPLQIGGSTDTYLLRPLNQCNYYERQYAILAKIEDEREDFELSS